MVTYLQANEIIEHKTTKRPPFYSADGYGRKIPTRYMIKLSNKRWYRVYMCQISNAGTAYIVKNKGWLVIGPEAESVINP